MPKKSKASELTPIQRKKIAAAADVWNLLKHEIPKEQEAFYVICVDIRSGLLCPSMMIALGSVHSVEVHPREVFREAIRKAAAAIIVAHNHPSHDPTPSPEDIELTKRLRAVGELVGIPVIDHVILTQDTFKSIAEHMGTEF